MQQKKSLFTMSGVMVVLGLALTWPTGAFAASRYKVLHEFVNSVDGQGPDASLILDSKGNL